MQNKQFKRYLLEKEGFGKYIDNRYKEDVDFYFRIAFSDTDKPITIIIYNKLYYNSQSKENHIYKICLSKDRAYTIIEHFKRFDILK